MAAGNDLVGLDCVAVVRLGLVETCCVAAVGLVEEVIDDSHKRPPHSAHYQIKRMPHISST